MCVNNALLGFYLREHYYYYYLLLNKKNCFPYRIKMSNPSLNELKQIAKTIRIKNYKNKFKEELLSALDKLDNFSENNFEQS